MRKISGLLMAVFLGLLAGNVNAASMNVTSATSTAIGCGWCGTVCGPIKSGMMCPMIAVSAEKRCVNLNGVCTIQTTTTTTTSPMTCADLQKAGLTGQNYFSMCLSNGYPKVCFNKYSGVYQGCGQNDLNTCTDNNLNAAVNIQCDSSLAAMPTPVADIPCGSDAMCPSGQHCVSLPAAKCGSGAPCLMNQRVCRSVDSVTRCDNNQICPTGMHCNTTGDKTCAQGQSCTVVAPVCVPDAIPTSGKEILCYNDASFCPADQFCSKEGVTTGSCGFDQQSGLAYPCQQAVKYVCRPKTTGIPSNLSFDGTKLTWTPGKGGLLQVVKVGTDKAAVLAGCPNGGCTFATGPLSSTQDSIVVSENLLPNTIYYIMVANWDGTNIKNGATLEYIKSNSKFCSSDADCQANQYCGTYKTSCGRDPQSGQLLPCQDRPGMFCQLKPTLMADANGDGKADLVDFAIWKNEYLTFVQNPATSFDSSMWKSDFNKDGKVDLVDFSIWKSAYLSNQ